MFKQEKISENPKNATSRTVKFVICILVLLVIGLAVAIIIISVNNSRNSDRVSSCSKTLLHKAKYARSQDLYRDLSKDELLQVRNYILNDASLNVTPHEKATLNSNYIFLIELQNPIKDDAIAYLDHNGPKPTRVANVIIFKGRASPPVVEEILVYFDKPMRHEPNTQLTNRTIPFHARPMSRRKQAILGEIAKDFGKRADKILKGLFEGYVVTNCTDRCLTFFALGPNRMSDSKEFISSVWFVRNVPGSIIQPVGLELLIQGEGLDGGKWKTRVRICCITTSVLHFVTYSNMKMCYIPPEIL